MFSFRPDEKAVLDQATSLLDSEEHSRALEVVRTRLAGTFSLDTPHDAILKGTLAGLLIDIGAEGRIEAAVREGLHILESERPVLGRFQKLASYEYNLGNAHKTIFNLERLKPGFRIRPDSIASLLLAVKHYWKSYKNLDDSRVPFASQVLTNLAGSLSTCGRVSEALHLYDEALRINPELPQAYANRAECLMWFHQLSNGYALNLLHQAWAGYAYAAESKLLPSSMRQEYIRKRDFLEGVLRESGKSPEDFGHDQMLTGEEAKRHSAYRRFCLENDLCLSEHSIYCDCAGARRDDLSIPTSGQSIGGRFVPRMSLYLNRMKSEFSLARLLYYQSGRPLRGAWATYESEVVFTELFENEAIGPRPEMLRTSFRLCFGVLDKIARALCDLFELAERDESILFHSFWKPRGRGSGEQGRWQRLNQIENYSIVALYSIAAELNQVDGEWGDLRKWRNALEHGHLIIVEDALMPDPFRLLEGEQSVQSVPYELFDFATRRLLQLTRSAILSFVFCVRHEGLRDAGSEHAVPFTLSHKPMR
jgi:tetratricopeptide (TPR) repeat protein